MNWENGSWDKLRKHYCVDHKKVLWYACYAALHINCSCEEIVDWRNVKELLELVRNLFDQIQINAKIHNIYDHIKDFKDEVKPFWDSLLLFETNVSLFFILYSLWMQKKKMIFLNSEQFWMI